MNYLLTYNPDSREWSRKEGENRLRDEIAAARDNIPVRWNCAQSVMKGSGGFLLRLGAPRGRYDPDFRGIFGLAEASCNAFPGQGDEQNYWFAYWHLICIADPERNGPIIPIEELERRFPPTGFWHPQKSDARTILPDSTNAWELKCEILARKE